MNFKAAAIQFAKRHKKLGVVVPVLLSLAGCMGGPSSWDYVNPNYPNDPDLCMEIIPNSGGTAFFTYDTPYAHLSGSVYGALAAANNSQVNNLGYSYPNGYYVYTSPVYTSIDGQGTIGGIAVKVTGGQNGSTVTDWNKQVFVPTTASQMQTQVINPMWHEIDVEATQGGAGLSPTGTCYGRHAQLQATAPWALGPSLN